MAKHKFPKPPKGATRPILNEPDTMDSIYLRKAQALHQQMGIIGAPSVSPAAVNGANNTLAGTQVAAKFGVNGGYSNPVDPGKLV